LSQVTIKNLPDSRIPELLDFFEKWAPTHPELAEGKIIRWQKCHRFIAECDGRIVGYIGQIPHIFLYGRNRDSDKIENIGWGVTLVLDMSENTIRKQAGRGLLSRCENNPPLRFAGVGIVPTIEEPYIRRGYQIRRDCSKYYARFKHPSKALKYLNKSVILTPTIIAANSIFRSPKSIKSDQLFEISHFKSEWDLMWNNILFDQYEFYGERTAEFLNYKLTQPDRDYKTYFHPEGGYIIFRLAEHRIKPFKIVKICDLVGVRSVKLQLLSKAMAFVEHTNADGIISLDSEKDNLVYKNAGLYISRDYPIALPKDIEAKMRVSFFDSDLDNLW